MLADLIGDESAPPVLRDLAEVACETLDCFSAPESEIYDDLEFVFVDTKITPESVCEHVPAMIVKIWNWRASCECCGETIKHALTIDHRQNDGAEHRRQIPDVRDLYRNIIAQGCPRERFAILCQNCHNSKNERGNVRT